MECGRAGLPLQQGDDELPKQAEARGLLLEHTVVESGNASR